MNPNYLNGIWLLVEDDETDQMFFRKAYEEIGIPNKLVIKENGEEALEYLRTNPETPFMIISDINMPKMNGLELLKEIQADTRINLKSIPFIIISSSTSDEEVRASYNFGVQGYFQKPFKQQDFVKIVRQINDYWISCKHPIA